MLLWIFFMINVIYSLYLIFNRSLPTKVNELVNEISKESTVRTCTPLLVPHTFNLFCLYYVSLEVLNMHMFIFGRSNYVQIFRINDFHQDGLKIKWLQIQKYMWISSSYIPCNYKYQFILEQQWKRIQKISLSFAFPQVLVSRP